MIEWDPHNHSCCTSLWGVHVTGTLHLRGDQKRHHLEPPIGSRTYLKQRQRAILSLVGENCLWKKSSKVANTGLLETSASFRP